MFVQILTLVSCEFVRLAEGAVLSATSGGRGETYAPLSTCTELHLSGKFLSLIRGQSEVRSSRLPAKFRCSKRVT